jgi:hypothetical protein
MENPPGKRQTCPHQSKANTNRAGESLSEGTAWCLAATAPSPMTRCLP